MDEFEGGWEGGSFPVMPVLVVAVGGILLHVMVALKSKLLLKEALRARAIVQAR